MELLVVIAVVSLGVFWWRKFRRSKSTNDESEGVGACGVVSRHAIRSAGQLLNLTYRDAVGDVTVRTVQMTGDGNRESFQAECRLRGELRTFYYRGIESATTQADAKVLSLEEVFGLGSPGVRVPLEIQWSVAWRLLCPLLIFLREWRPGGIRVRERSALKALLQSAMGESSVPDEVFQQLIKIRTSGTNARYFSARLSSGEKLACLEVVRLISDEDGAMEAAAASVFA